MFYIKCSDSFFRQNQSDLTTFFNLTGMGFSFVTLCLLIKFFRSKEFNDLMENLIKETESQNIMEDSSKKSSKNQFLIPMKYLVIFGLYSMAFLPSCVGPLMCLFFENSNEPMFMIVVIFLTALFLSIMVSMAVVLEYYKYQKSLDTFSKQELLFVSKVFYLNLGIYILGTISILLFLFTSVDSFSKKFFLSLSILLFVLLAIFLNIKQSNDAKALKEEFQKTKL